VRSRARLILFLLTAVATASCGSVCGLGRRGRVTFSGGVPCCGGSTFQDVALSGAAGGAEFDLASTAKPSEPGLADAFLVPTSCSKLFDGPYPGATPLCQILLGPTAPGKVSGRAQLPAGTYRLWLQGYTTNGTDAPYLIDIGIWNHDCRSPVLQ
jgi:hypothetical protein